MSAAARLTINGLDELRARLRLAPRQFDYALRIAVRRAGSRVAKESKTFLPAGSPLARTISSHVIAHPIFSEISSAASNSRVVSIHAGRTPGHPPSIEALTRWLARYGPRSDPRKQRAVAIKIMEAIRVRGTAPIPFLTGALARTADEIERYVVDAVGYVLRKIAKG